MTPTEVSKLVSEQVRQLQVEPVLELYILDATDLGGDIFRFYPGTKENYSSVVFDGNTYIPLPVEMTGFEWGTRGEPPRPTVKFANIEGLFTSLVLNFSDLSGAEVRRLRVFKKYLTGEPAANSNGLIADDVFFIERKTLETQEYVEFELITPLDRLTARFPRRQIFANICRHGYRTPECGYAENLVVRDSAGNDYTGLTQNYRGEWAPGEVYAYLDVVYVLVRNVKVYYLHNTPGAFLTGAAHKPPYAAWVRDVCNKRLSSGCRPRFDAGVNATPINFPGVTVSKNGKKLVASSGVFFPAYVGAQLTTIGPQNQTGFIRTVLSGTEVELEYALTFAEASRAFFIVRRFSSSSLPFLGFPGVAKVPQ